MDALRLCTFGIGSFAFLIRFVLRCCTRTSTWIHLIRLKERFRLPGRLAGWHRGSPTEDRKTRYRIRPCSTCQAKGLEGPRRVRSLGLGALFSESSSLYHHHDSCNSASRHRHRHRFQDAVARVTLADSFNQEPCEVLKNRCCALSFEHTAPNSSIPASTLHLRYDRDSVRTANLEEPKTRAAAVRRRALAIATNPLFVFAVAASVALIVLLVVQDRTASQARFRPSTVDWANWTQYYPVTSVKPLPTGKPRDIPKIQFDFPLYRPDPVARQRQQAVKDVFVKGWESYKEIAWGYDELLPVSGGWQNTLGGWGVTMIDALDTLYIMGLRDEFDFATQTIAQLDWANSTYRDINVFETTIRHLGGLLSSYDLSGERTLLQKAEELGNMLYLAFDTPNRLPPFLLDFTDAQNGTQVAGDYDPAAGPTSLSLEFTRLAQLTGENKFYDAIDRVTTFLARSQNQSAIPGLWPMLINFRDEDVTLDTSFTLGANSDSLYEYFPKMHLLLGGLDPVYEALYRTSMDTAIEHLLFRPMLPLANNTLLFAGDASTDTGTITPVPTGQHLACFTGGMFSLGGKIFGNATHLAIGDRLARSCAWAYSSFPTGVMPEKFGMLPCANLTGPCWWDAALWGRKGDLSLPEGFANAQDPRYLLRPEAIESVFLLYRMTGSEDLRDIAWDMFRSIVNATTTEYANSAIANVTVRGETDKLDTMDVSFWTSRERMDGVCGVLTAGNRVSGCLRR